ncbi:polysaccharide deacetylase [Paenibacillus sp. TRM 82003]|nr:polysaccharide deacetylase [Paenibacillus sp. TRM 82003]
MGKNKEETYALDVPKKERDKRVRTVAQLLALLALGFALFHAIFDMESYAAPDPSSFDNTEGFIALSYFGIGRTGTGKLISQRELDRQLGALHDQGYVTISQRQMLDFLRDGKPLPEKALFLSFEDGRNDSSLFAQPILEKYNYKATMLTYANKMLGSDDRKFLRPKELLRLTGTGYWELGSNGYRLAYINMFDRDGRFIGMKDESELAHVGDLAFYNHYLMDFIRDEHMIPTEERAEMERRIAFDYEKMEENYRTTLGFVPSVYMIMHANALGGGANPLVTNANETHIRRLFAMHFNREGSAFNARGDNPYDLTRVQPAAYWHTNHLLMKLRKDTGEDIKFLIGDETQASRWDMRAGRAYFEGNRIVLTSPPGEAGRLALPGSDGWRDLDASATLTGNVVGRQSIYLRLDEETGAYLRVSLENNELYVEERTAGGAVKRLRSQKLDDLAWDAEELAFRRATVYTREQIRTGVGDEGLYPVNLSGTRKLQLSLRGGALSVAVDGRILWASVAVDPASAAGVVALEARYHEQNEKDDIYDGVFEDVEIVGREAVDAGGATPTESGFRYTNRLEGLQKQIHLATTAANAVLDWVMENF